MSDCSLLFAVAATSNLAVTPEEALHFAVEKIGVGMGWPVGHVYLYEDGALVPSEIWYLDDPEPFRVMRKVTHATTFTPGDGSLPGRVFDTGKPAWIEDVTADPRFLRTRNGANLGVRAAFAFPVPAHGGVVAVAEFFSARVLAPDEPTLDVVANIGTHLGRVFEREAAERALRESTELTRAFIEALPGLAFILDEDGRYVEVFATREPLLYGPASSLKGRRLHDVLPRESADLFLSVVRRALGTGRPTTVEYELEVPAGTCWFEGQVAPMLGAPGGRRMAVWIAHDITKRKQTEEALRESEARYRLLADHSTDLIVRSTPEGVITYASPSCRTLLGYEPEEMAGQSGYSFLHPDDFPQTEGAHEALLDVPDVQTVQYRFRKKDGTYLWVESTAKAIRDPETDAVLELISSTRDVTERRRHEEALRQSREVLRSLARRLQAVREEERMRLSREVHDVLGQALTGLRMDLAMIEKDVPGGIPTLNERLDTMKQAINETIQVTRRIAHDLRPGILDDLGVLSALEWEAQKFEARTGIACAFVDEAGELDLDPERSTAIFRVCQEILTNVARHAGATGVEITVGIRDDCFVLTVKDNGRGIRDEDMTQTKSLGLLSMRERLLPWDGHVDLIGVPDEGTTVTVALPLMHVQPTV